MRHRIVAACVLGLLALGASAQEARESDAVKVSWVPTVREISPGAAFDLAVRFTIPAGWHIYWKNPGSSGIPTTVTVKAPPGFVVGSLLWPRPHALGEGEDVVYAYEKEVVLFIPVTAPAEPPAGPAMFEAEASWLVCKESCMAGSAKLALQIPAPTAAAAPAEKDLLALAIRKKQLPRGFVELKELKVEHGSGEVTLVAAVGLFKTAHFYPVDLPGIRLSAPEIRIDGPTLRLKLGYEIKPNELKGPPRLEGLIALGDGDDDPSFDLSYALETIKPVK